MPLTDQTAGPWVATLQNFERYAANWWHLSDKQGDWVPFRLRRCQRILNNEYERQMDDRGFVRMNVLKLRQGGVTTWCTARLLHRTMTQAGTALTLAHDQKLPESWLARCRSWRDETPKTTPPDLPVRPGIGVTQQNALSFSGLPSRYYVGSAGGGFPGMGDRINALHLSEVGSWDKSPVSVDPDKVLHDLTPALPWNAIYIRESTGKMRGDWWQKHWDEGKRGGDGFRNVFLPWFLQEEYRSERLASDVLSLDAYEQRLVREAKRHGIDLTHAHLGWRRQGIREFLGKVDEWACRYPAYEDEAFLAPGLAVYTPDMVRAARETQRPPVWRGNLTYPTPTCSPDQAGRIASDAGEMQVWEWPDENFHYVLGADCQWGAKDTADYDVLYVECLETGRLVAKAKGRYPLSEWGRKIAAVGHLYNDCPVAPERNALAADGLMPLLLGQVAPWSYPSVWIRAKEVTIRPRVEDYGWLTNEHTKPQLIQQSQTATVDGSFDWCDVDAVDQMQTIVRDEDNKVGAPKGAHDDDWMARIITHYVAHVERPRTKLYVEPQPTVYEFTSMEQRLSAMAAGTFEDELITDGV